MLWTMAAFALALGVSAHMLDELNGRPSEDAHPLDASWSLSRTAALAGACAIGIWAATRLGLRAARLRRRRSVRRPRLQPRVVRRRIHNAWGLALAWGALPVLTAYFAEAGTLRVPAILAAAFATGMILVQRALSTPVREARRQRGTLAGVEPMERALRILPWANVLLAAALVSARLT